ncbi:ribonuclease P [archaeon]|jgi:ribonuclease P protein subunit RPR2|nr:ribonuclease P [archaeon]MBT4352635.1 ribonuclease P [archaeon]MBT4647237.1 ribonuclease P [archaeon]MBT6821026.1 ribonuclease P [archaeon]MBT7391455.1 ribonuclease P [archaeon]
MAKRNVKQEKVNKKIASERIDELFLQADNIFKEDSSLSDRYVEIARKICMKLNLSMPRVYKRRYCSTCYKFLVPGVNCRIRLTQKKVVYHCNNCKNYMRIPYWKKKEKIVKK